MRFENERVAEMIEIVREKTGRQFVIFIIDEVGQYVASRPNLILNLDGLAKNLKAIGDGRVWIVGTAQQTLTEDDPRAALNSPELYKLAARFPIQIDLESSDIKEICYRRLLGKSPSGEQILGALFDRCGQALRYNTKLQDARYYDSDFDRSTFVNLYPFLPAHFDILLHLLGALAKSTGGIGLRSAIKVIQDILIEGAPEHPAVADRPVGWLATTVTLYDSLEKDIRRAEPSIHKGVGKALIRFTHSTVHQEVAKTVAVLQILGNMPVTAQNVASLMHPGVEVSSRRDEVEAAIKALIEDGMVPFGEKDGNLCFFSERLNDIDQERAQIPLRTIETRRIQNEALREAFSPLPAARLHDSLTITTGLKAAFGALVASLAGERETIQSIVELVDPTDYEATRGRLMDESRQHSSKHTIFVLGRSAPEIGDKVAEIYRCREIVQRYRNDPDDEVRDYCTGQSDRAAKRGLGRGSFIFRGQITAAESLGADVVDALKKHLGAVADQVFDRYAEAPVRADTALAEKFLRVGNLKAVTSALDPLGLVQISAGTPRVQTNHKALVSMRDYIERNGTVEGKRLLEYFADAPFGWSPDTLRYLAAALLVAGEIKLKVSGREVTVNGQHAIDALRTNNAFKTVGVSLRDGRPSLDVLARAAQRLTDLLGDAIIPLEDEISKAAVKHFPQFQYRFGPLAEKLNALGLPGADAVRALNQTLADVLLTDASDAPLRLGGEESPLYQGLKWATAVNVALKNGLETTARDLRQHTREIAVLPDSGVPGQLRTDLADDLTQIEERLGQENFYQYGADLATRLTAIKARVRTTAAAMLASQRTLISEGQAELQQLTEWNELTQEEQAQELARLDELAIEAALDLAGLRRLLSQAYVIQTRAREARRRIEQLGRQRQLERIIAETGVWSTAVKIPKRVTSVESLDALIRQLEALKPQSLGYRTIEVTIELED